MKILAIETSCDETAVCIVDCEGSFEDATFIMKVLGNIVHSQVEQHKEFGGVVPMMAKREHAKNLIPIFMKVLEKSQITFSSAIIPDKRLEEMFGREVEFKNDFIEMIKTISKNQTEDIECLDAIVVTEGPGLEPALWMGIIFAQALSEVFNIPLIPVNHMEGHIFAALSDIKKKMEFPVISLLISGGHTELVLMKEWNEYEIIGETRDDAVGEAFDKVARMLGLPYPGGPEISKLAHLERTHKTSTIPYLLPRPMIKSDDYDFSFSGLKTAVRYSLEDHQNIQRGTEIPKQIIAKEFEDAVTEVLISKTFRAIEDYNAHTLILGGGVISNIYICSEFEEKIKKMPEVKLLIPAQELRTDNALMIAVAGYFKSTYSQKFEAPRAQGGLKFP